MLIRASNSELVNLPSNRELDSRWYIMAPWVPKCCRDGCPVAMLFSPQVKHITNDAGHSSGSTTVRFKGKWNKSGVGWWSGSWFGSGSTDVFCKSVLLAGISIICGGAGNGRIRQGESRCTSSAAGAAGVGDDEVDDEVTALPGIIGDFEIWHVTFFWIFFL